MTPLNQLRAPATDVALPVFARLGDDHARAAEYLKRGQLAFGYTIVPAMAAVVGAVRPDRGGPARVRTGPASRRSSRCSRSPRRCQTLAYIGFWVYVSRGLATQLFRYTVLTLFLQLACISIGSIWGVVGVAAGYATAAVLEWPLSLMWLSRLTPIPVGAARGRRAHPRLRGAGRRGRGAGRRGLRPTSDVLARPSRAGRDAVYAVPPWCR